MNRLLFKDIVEHALKEDICNGDITTSSIFSDEEGEAVIITREQGILAGLPIVKEVFLLCDSILSFIDFKKDGERFMPGDEIVGIKGRVSSILTAERTALNFLQRLSGIATLSDKASAIVNQYNAKITDTRKTTPGLRVLEKYAVLIGGGMNHRFSLSDLALIKDNHIKAAGSIGEAVKRVRAKSGFTAKIEVETSTMDEVKEALAMKADIIMLDNMSIKAMKEAVELIDNRAIIEASGRITLENLKDIAETGVDYISMGMLTHNVKALDMALMVV